MKIAFANDHAAVASRHLIAELKLAGHDVVDYGVPTEDRVDYPDVAAPALKALVDGEVERTVLACGSGIGMSIVANRVPGVRCALVLDDYSAEMSRHHNNSNCIALRSRHQSEQENSRLLKLWLNTKFEHGRHERRNEKIETVAPGCEAQRLNHEGENK